MRRSRFLMSVLIFMIGIARPAVADPGTDLILDTADGPRHALGFTTGEGPRPTIVVLHGSGGTGAETAVAFGFVEAARSEGFNAVFPDGLDHHWHDARFNEALRPDDVAYLSALAARLVADRISLPERLYLIGISNGGMMSFTLACRVGALFAGVATIGAAMPAVLTGCAVKPQRLVMINGTADPIVPYGGGDVISGPARDGTVLGVEETAALFAQADGCTKPVALPLPHLDPADATTVTQINWAGCRPLTSVTVYRVEGGGHTLPGYPSVDPATFGASNGDIDTAAVIMAAFATPY